MQRIPSQIEKILKMLKDAGEDGVTNIELATVSFKYDARISELRMKGYEIETQYVGKSIYKYILKKIPSNYYDFSSATDEIIMDLYDEFGDVVSTYFADQLEKKHFHVTRKSGWYKTKKIQ